MKKLCFIFNSKKPFIYLIGLLIMSSFYLACGKQELNSGHDQRLIGEFELLDLMIVNSENGKPQKEQNLHVLGNQLILNRNGSLSSFNDLTSKLQIGTWTLNSGKMILTLEDSPEIELNLIKLGEDQMELEQHFEANGNLAEGNISYTFEKMIIN